MRRAGRWSNSTIASHFTSSRLAALDLYSSGAAVGFDLEPPTGRSAAKWCATTDALSRGMPAKGFGFGGVPRERAYHDALRDLATRRWATRR